MKIEFWLDYLCPVSYQVHQNLERVLKKHFFEDLELLYRSYPLAQDNSTASIIDVLANHRKIDMDEAKEICQSIRGIEHIPVVDMQPAHLLSHLAKKKGKAFTYHCLLFKAYFEDRLDISQTDVLMHIGLMTGLKAEEIKEAFSNQQFHHAILSNKENALMKGIMQIPHMRINGGIRLQGYQTYEQLEAILLRADFNLIKDLYCEDDYCSRKKNQI